MLTVLSGPTTATPMLCRPRTRIISTGLEEGVRGWRIAYSPTLGYAKVDPEIAAAAAEAARQFEALGAIVEQVDAIFRFAARRAVHTVGGGRGKASRGVPR